MLKGLTVKDVNRGFANMRNSKGFGEFSPSAKKFRDLCLDGRPPALSCSDAFDQYRVCRSLQTSEYTHPVYAETAKRISRTQGLREMQEQQIYHQFKEIFEEVTEDYKAGVEFNHFDSRNSIRTRASREVYEANIGKIKSLIGSQ